MKIFFVLVIMFFLFSPVVFAQTPTLTPTVIPISTPIPTVTPIPTSTPVPVPTSSCTSCDIYLPIIVQKLDIIIQQNNDILAKQDQQLFYLQNIQDSIQGMNSQGITNTIQTVWAIQTVQAQFPPYYTRSITTPAGLEEVRFYQTQDAGQDAFLKFGFIISVIYVALRAFWRY